MDDRRLNVLMERAKQAVVAPKKRKYNQTKIKLTSTKSKQPNKPKKQRVERDEKEETEPINEEKEAKQDDEEEEEKQPIAKAKKRKKPSEKQTKMDYFLGLIERAQQVDKKDKKKKKRKRDVDDDEEDEQPTSEEKEEEEENDQADPDALEIPTHTTRLKKSKLSATYSFPSSCLTEKQWKFHKGNLTLQPIDAYSERQKQKGNFKRAFFGKKKPVIVWGAPANSGVYVVPPQYGLLHFGKPDTDLRGMGTDIDVQWNPEMKLWGSEPDKECNQQLVVKKIMDTYMTQQRGGLVELSTSSGKTMVACRVIYELRKKTAILLPSTELLIQWRARLEVCLPGIRIGIVQGEKCEIDDVDILLVMIQTLASRDYKKDKFDSVSHVILDETDVMCAPQMAQGIAKVSKAIWMLGLTATLKRTDGMDKLLRLWCGGLIHRGQLATLSSRQTTVESVLFMRGNQQMCYTKEFDKGEEKDTDQPDAAKTMELLVSDPERNAFLIQELARLITEEKRRVIVLTTRKDHAYWLVVELRKRIDPELYKLIWFRRGMPAELRNKMDTEPFSCLISTFSLCGRGLDFGCADTLLLSCSKVQVKQAIGRLRSFCKFDIKRQPLKIVDVCDMFGFFQTQRFRRLAIYKSRKMRFAKLRKITEPIVIPTDQEEFPIPGKLPKLAPGEVLLEPKKKRKRKEAIKKPKKPKEEKPKRRKKDKPTKVEEKENQKEDASNTSAAVISVDQPPTERLESGKRKRKKSSKSGKKEKKPKKSKSSKRKKKEESRDEPSIQTEDHTRHDLDSPPPLERVIPLETLALML